MHNIITPKALTYLSNMQNPYSKFPTCLQNVHYNLYSFLNPGSRRDRAFCRAELTYRGFQRWWWGSPGLEAGS